MMQQKSLNGGRCIKVKDEEGCLEFWNCQASHLCDDVGKRHTNVIHASEHNHSDIFLDHRTRCSWQCAGLLHCIALHQSPVVQQQQQQRQQLLPPNSSSSDRCSPLKLLANKHYLAEHTNSVNCFSSNYPRLHSSAHLGSTKLLCLWQQQLQVSLGGGAESGRCDGSGAGGFLCSRLQEGS